MVDGDRNAQFRLLKSPWTARKIFLRLTKWSIWLLIAVATGGAWVFYFADAPTLFVDMFTGNAAFVAYGAGLIAVYFMEFFTLMNRSLFVMGGGAVLIAGVYLLERQRRTAGAAGAEGASS